ncbi:hypothetical protein V491_06727 [Pseudogymnoascus sp. VKM F-3775]|nr:hypothetical protein V491_06727 [Pseudogymnoascus sp. VKM F-3775]
MGRRNVVERGAKRLSWGWARAIGDVRWEDRENRNVASEYRFCRSKGKMMQPRYMQSTPNNEYSRRIPEVVTENENERVSKPDKFAKIAWGFADDAGVINSTVRVHSLRSTLYSNSFMAIETVGGSGWKRAGSGLAAWLAVAGSVMRGWQRWLAGYYCWL